MSVLEAPERDDSSVRSPRAMRKTQIYINWVNSVLGEAGGHVDGVEAVQDGKVLCELIDVLAPDAGLQAKVKQSGDCTPLAYINTALEHMKSHGIKVKFPAEDIVHNEIKSMLDVLWILILNYGIHFIGQNAFQRSVGIGKKVLLEWCAEELDTTFDPRNTLSFNLCSGNWFLKLLEKVAGCSMEKSQDKSEYIDALLAEIQDRYLIKKDIIKAHDIVDGTVDEHTLMIYLSLLKRRVSDSERHSRREMLSTDGKAAAMAKIHFFEKRARSLSSDSQRSKSADSVQGFPPTRGRSQSNSGRSISANSDINPIRNRSRSLFEQVTGDGNETSDWSSTGSLVSGREKSSPKGVSSPHGAPSGDELLYQTISERVTEHLPDPGSDRDVGKEMETQRISEKETDTLSDYSSSSLTKEKPPSKPAMPTAVLQQEQHRASNPESVSGSFTQNGNSRTDTAFSQERPQSDLRENQNGASHLNEESLSHRPEENPRNGEPREENVRIRIKRPKDYIRQWEDTMDRLSGVPSTDEMGSPRAPLITNYKASNRSKSSDVNGGTLKTTSSSSSYEHRYTPSLRSRSTGDTMPKITISSSQSYSSRSLTNSAQSTNGNEILTSGSQRNGTNEGLNSVLDRLPENMRQQAQEASKFLMHTSGPEVLDLIEAIKSARDGVHSTMPASSQRPQRPQPPSANGNGHSEQTILKRRDNSETSSTLSRVRFQPTVSTSQATRRLQSGVPRSTATHVSTSPASPRVHSSSPRRRITPLNDGERGSDRMLSISPRSPRSRSLSPRMTAARETGTDSRSPRVHNSIDESFSSGSRPLREDLLLKNLGLNTRTVEDEHPSTRLRTMGSSPRVTGSDSPGRMYTSSPRKPLVERLPLNSAYPELTRLDLGLDSDRSYLSHMDDGREDSPPPIRRGGSGRVPRREAWELQRQQKDPIGGSRADSVAQSKFIDVLCKEIEVLKQKVELMEEEGARRSLSRPSRSPSAPANSRTGSSYLSKEIRDENSHMIFATQSVASNPDRERAISCPLLQVSSRSTAVRSSPRLPSAGSISSTTVKRPVATLASLINSRTPTRGRVASPQRQGGITLGYSSPARSVTPEIWGNNLNSPRALDPETQEKWKQLISQRNLTEAETIELKQALACAIVENDILSAKLNNARHEIHDKLKHTNSVLDDCRRHLAKSNAENMELRSALEQEKEKNAEFESRIKELENNVFEVKTDNQQLENELDQTANLLDRSMTETKGVDALKAENTKLISRLANVENENDSLSEEVRNLKRSNTKAMNTMDELRDCLTKVRRERQELYDEVTSLQRRQQTSRVREIISSYQEKGSRDERETERDLSRSFFDLPDTDEGVFSGSQASTDHHFRQNSSRINRSYDDEEMIPVRPIKSLVNDRSFKSPRQMTPRSQHNYYSFDDMSPTSYREIYPHRKSYTPRSRSCSPHQQPLRSSSPGYCSPLLFDESFVDQTLQEIEQDMKRDRQKILNSTPVAHRRLRFSSYPSEENLNTSFSSQHYRATSFDQGSSPSRINQTLYSQTSNSHNRSFQGHANSPSASARDRSLGRLNKSLNSAEDLRKERSRSSSPYQPSPRPSILKGKDRLSRDILSTLRSQSPSAERNRNTGPLHKKPRNVTPEHCPNVSPRYFPRECHSPPTRLSPERDIERKTSAKRRPLHTKSGAFQIARSLQKEFDSEDKLLKSFSKSSVFQNKSWFEMQSESDGEDTGINSSMSSRSSCERPVSTRKKTPLLTEQQKRYADELIVKYTGNAPI